MPAQEREFAMDEGKPRNQAASASNPPSRKAMPPFESLRAFDAVARLQGVRKAAVSLGRDHTGISRHLRVIEAWTGTKLIERTSTGIVLTEDGTRYHQQISNAMDLIAQATLDLMRRGENNNLNIWCMPGFALHWLSGRIADFEKKHAGVDIEIRPTERSPDFSSHDTDVNIRFVPMYGVPFQLAPGLKSLEVARLPIVAVASPAYLAASAPITTPSDLLQHHLLHEDNYERWSKWLVAHGVPDGVELTGPRLWQGHLTIDAARHGRGIALANHLVAADDLASGRLIEIGTKLDSFQPRIDGVYLLIARADRWDASLIRRFRQWLTTTLAEDLRR
jgi:LysR family transcriptional regulator, glycine cleavage system transcriptional activator